MQTNRKAHMPSAYLPYLEGMRGVAALYVVVYHIRGLIDPNYEVFGPAAALIPGYGLYLRFGHASVGLFIVISGFVLTIPIARRRISRIGFFEFMRRRFKRLLPAYYAALVLSLPFWFAGLRVDGVSTNFVHFAGDLALHVLLVHDLFINTIFQINGPLWSVAVEIQIYAVFALVLVKIQRRADIFVAATVAFALGLLPTAIAAALDKAVPYPLQYAHFWYLGLFALGSAAAYIVYEAERYALLRELIPWKMLSILGILGWIFALAPQWSVPEQAPAPLSDMLLGVGLAAGFVAIARDESAGRRSLVARVFSSAVLIRLGSFSYSLYLIHYTVIWATLEFAQRYVPAVRLAIGIALLFLIIPSAYLFARVFEFPFMSTFRQRRDDEAINSAIIQSARDDGPYGVTG